MENINTEFQYDGDNFQFTPQMKQAFDECGYILIRNVLSNEEVLKVKTAVSNSQEIQKYAYGIPDDQGGRSRLCLWNHPGNDITGMVARCEKVAGVSEKVDFNGNFRGFVQKFGKEIEDQTLLLVCAPHHDCLHHVQQRTRPATSSFGGRGNTSGSYGFSMFSLSHVMDSSGRMTKLLGGEVYHYHTKLMMKDAFTGGKFSWHQDYGYWYKNGCLYPDMMTVFLPVDECNKENGCLQILRGSHKCGRIEHLMVGGQTGADMERVDELKKKLPLEYVEMKPGDGLYFHCNLLHTSSPNKSANRRWAFLVAYNRASNDPVYEHHCPGYTPLHKVPDSAVIECEDVNMSGKGFLDADTDKTIKMKN